MQPEYTERFLHKNMEYYREYYKNSPKWDGEDDLSNKKVIVYGEQGHGDIIQFLRYIPLLKKKDCNISVHCPKNLHNLILENLEGVSDCFEDGIDDLKLPDHDYHIPSMSLPFLLGTYEAEVPYIFPKTKTIDETDKFKIGVAWEGNPNHSNNHERCCPLGVFRKISMIDDVKLFMIQKEIFNLDLTKDCDDLSIYGTNLNNFQDTANLINSMDLIISVDTSVLHLSGAIGKKAIGLISFNHDYRWDLDINWYPSVKLLKQKSPNDWQSIASEIYMHVNMNLQKWKFK